MARLPATLSHLRHLITVKVDRYSLLHHFLTVTLNPLVPLGFPISDVELNNLALTW